VLGCLAAKALTVAATVIIAAPTGSAAKVKELCPGCQVIEGGDTRQTTVQLLVQACDAPWLLIQDAARPFVSVDLLRAVHHAARETGAAGAFLDPEVPVARLEDGLVIEQFAASQVGIFQAPQVFSRTVLEHSLAAAQAGGWLAQSTLQLVLRAGVKVRAVPGEKTNIKLTTAADWLMAPALEKLL
jgi:2-C-methyl-D-erythritol 4-phosphate cytidylyltransferase